MIQYINIILYCIIGTSYVHNKLTLHNNYYGAALSATIKFNYIFAIIYNYTVVNIVNVIRYSANIHGR